MILIGSKALKYWIPTGRIGVDWDLIATKDELNQLIAINDVSFNKSLHNGEKHHLIINGEKLEIELLTHNSSNELIDVIADNKIIKIFGIETRVANLPTLMMIKKAHLNWPIAWWKHIKDYHDIKNQNPEVLEIHHKILKLRMKETEARQKKLVKPNLMVSNEEFFGKSQRVIGRLYKHDDLHFSTCFYDRPLYEKLKYDKSLAWCDQQLFNTLNYLDKVRCVQEEAFAIALERKIIPALNDGQKIDTISAFCYAIERICTTLTSGWFRSFAQENVPQIMKHNVDFVGRFLSFLERKPNESI